MTVPAQATLFNESVANGVTTSFPYQFMIASAADITVELDGVVTTTGFTVTGVGNANGGSIDFSVAPANGVTVLRYLDSKLSRTEEDYQQFGDFNADTVDLEYDRIWLALQSLALKIGLCVRAPISSASGVLPVPAANNVIGWDEFGTGFKNYLPVDNTLISIELAGTDGASRIGYLPAGVGAVATDVETKLRESLSIQDFMTEADRTANYLSPGSIDATYAAQKAINESIAQGGCAIHVSGRYKLLGQLFVTGDNVNFVGSGVRSAQFSVEHDLGAAIVVQHASSPGSSYINSFGMRNMSVRARVETNSGSCLKLNKCQNVVLDNVYLVDHFGGVEILGGNQHYYSNLHIFSPRSSAPVSWTGSKSGSFFLKVDRSSDNQAPNEIFVTGFNFRRTETSNYIEHGVVINCVDGIWMSNGHIMGVASDDIHVEPVDGDEQITGIKIDNVWLDNNCAIGLHVVGNTTASFGEIELGEVRFLTPSNMGIFVEVTSTAFEGIRMSGGAMRKTGTYGALLRAGKSHVFSGVDFGACNTGAGANTGAITIDQGADKVNVNGCVFDKTALGVTANSMIGVRINAAASSNVSVTGCQFDLTADDISDASTSDANAYPSNITTKAATATAVAGSSLTIAEIGDQFYVSAGLNFSNMSGRWNQRTVKLVFAGASTVTHGAGGIRLAGSVNFVAKAGDTLTLFYSPDLADWIETSRMIS